MHISTKYIRVHIYAQTYPCVYPQTYIPCHKLVSGGNPDRATKLTYNNKCFPAKKKARHLREPSFLPKVSENLRESSFLPKASENIARV